MEFENGNLVNCIQIATRLTVTRTRLLKSRFVSFKIGIAKSADTRKA